MKPNKVAKVKTFLIRLHDSCRARDEAELNAFLATVKIKRLFSSLANIGEHGAAWSVLLFYEECGPMSGQPLELRQLDDIGRIIEPPEIHLTDTEQLVYDALRKWRNERAHDEGLEPYMICSNEALKEIVRMKPDNTEDLRKIRGIKDRRISKYGGSILAVLRGEIVSSDYESDEDDK